MSLDDLLEPEVMIAVGVTAAVMSPGVRKVLRRGAVLGPEVERCGRAQTPRDAVQHARARAAPRGAEHATSAPAKSTGAIR